MKIGAITIGQSPRDDIIPEMRDILTQNIKIIEKGVLDGISSEDIKNFYPDKTDFPIVTRLKNGTEVKVARKKIVPGLKNCISELEKDEVDVIVLLCTGEFPEIKSEKILMEPHKIMVNIVRSIKEKGKLCIIVPSSDQISLINKRWKRISPDIISIPFSPYSGKDDEIIKKAEKIVELNVDLIILDCIGFTRKIKSILRDITGKPVLLPRTIIARILQELIEI